MHTPIVAINNYIKSFLKSSSPNIIHPIMAVVGGIRKNKLDVFDADPILIKYIRIVKALKKTNKNGKKFNIFNYIVIRLYILKIKERLCQY